jgi:glucosamine kinase
MRRLWLGTARMRAMTPPLPAQTPLTLQAQTVPSSGLGLGLDAGGTHTRWAVADTTGRLWAQGTLAPVSGLQMGDEPGRAAITQALHQLAGDMQAQLVSAPASHVQHVVAGITGFDAAFVPVFCGLVASALQVQASAVHTMSDIELACHAAFAPGQGVVVYAGTGSVAALVDVHGVLHRAGGRGAVIDDGGGGYWIARQALRHVWRAEDEAPGAWRTSPLAQHLFERMGGSDWSHTRAWVYGASRGELGTLALQVAAAAASDPVAHQLLVSAGEELARLGRAMLARHGALPVALAGRVLDLHPAIEASLRSALPAGTPTHRLTLPAHHAAAVIAAKKSTAVT